LAGMYLFVIDALLEKGKEEPLRGMPNEGISSTDRTINSRNMGMASQIPAIALPHEEDARRELLYPLPIDITAKGVVALVVIGCAAIAGLFVLLSIDWYLGVAIFAVVALVLFGPFSRHVRPKRKGRNSND